MEFIIWYDFWLPVYNELQRHYLNSYFTKLAVQAAIDYSNCNVSPGADCVLVESVNSTKSVTDGEISWCFIAPLRREIARTWEWRHTFRIGVKTQITVIKMPDMYS